MHSAAGLFVSLVGLASFNPFACASTYEAWTDGLYDAESDDNAQAITSSEVVVDTTTLISYRCAGPVLRVQAMTVRRMLQPPLFEMRERPRLPNLVLLKLPPPVRLTAR